MKVILLENIQKLGNIIKEVDDNLVIMIILLLFQN